MTNCTKTYTFNTLYSLEEVYLVKRAYTNDSSLAVQMICTDGEPFTMVTVNLSGYGIEPSAPNCAFVKSYSENEGMDEFLKANNIAHPTGKVVRLGFTTVKEFEFDFDLFE